MTVRRIEALYVIHKKIEKQNTNNFFHTMLAIEEVKALAGSDKSKQEKERLINKSIKDFLNNEEN